MRQKLLHNMLRYHSRVHSLGPGSLISSWLDMAAHTVILAALCTSLMKMYGSSTADNIHILYAHYSMHMEIYNIRKPHTVQYGFFMFSPHSELQFMLSITCKCNCKIFWIKRLYTANSNTVLLVDFLELSCNATQYHVLGSMHTSSKMMVSLWKWTILLKVK